MRIHYDIHGDKEVIHDLLGIGARALESRPVLKGFASVLAQAEAELFDAEGKGAWPPLAASTVAAKGHSKILYETGDLRASLTEEGGGHVEEILGDELIYGTSVEYAIFHRTGTSRMPKRDPLPLPDEATLREFTRSLQAYLIGLERAEFGVGAFGIASLDPFGLS